MFDFDEVFKLISSFVQIDRTGAILNSELIATKRCVTTQMRLLLYFIIDF